jgi:WD40 repeat protein
LSEWDVRKSLVDGVSVNPHRPLHGLISCLSWSPDGSLLAAGSYGGNVALFNSSGSCVYMLKKVHPHGVTQVQWTTDSTTLVVGGRKSVCIKSFDIRMIARNPKNPTPLVSFARTVANNQRIVFDLLGKSRLVSGNTASGNVGVYDMVDGSKLQDVSLHQDVVSSVHIHPKLPLLLTGTGQRKSPFAEVGENVVSLWSLQHTWENVG